MGTRIARILLLGIGILMWMASLTTAQGLNRFDSELAKSSHRTTPTSQTEMRQVAYMSDMGAGEDGLPPGYGNPNGAYSGCQSCNGAGCAACGDCNSGQGCCGQSCGGDNCCGDSYCEGCCGDGYCGESFACQPQKGMWYAEAQATFMRPHVSEEAVGKLSEKYELSPRFIGGYESASGLGGRARYWTYGRTTQNLDDPNDGLRFEFDVIDVEGTHRFRSGRTDLVVAGGFRWTNIDIEFQDEEISAEMPGITFAADVRSVLCGGCRNEWSGVCGVRWSLLGGDWEGDDSLIEETRDDNISVQEIYGGFEYLCHHRGYDLYARLIFEVQNWHSDALGEGADVDSIGFIGPAVQVGTTF